MKHLRFLLPALLLAAWPVFLAARTWPPETASSASVATATTTAEGIVELATDREDAAGKVVQSNDTRLDPFLPSGASARSGLVPSPGGSAGTAKFLREDATWATPTELFDPGMELSDNTLRAMSVGEAANDYIVIDTVNSAEDITAYKALFVTDAVASGTARRVGGIASALVGPSTEILGTNENNTDFDISYTMPAGTLYRAGSVVKITAQVFCTNSEAGSGAAFEMTLAMRLNNNAVASTSSFNCGDEAIVPMQMTCMIRSPGASGTLMCGGTAVMGARGTSTGTSFLLGSGSGTTTTFTFDTTQAGQWEVALDYAATMNDLDSTRLDWMLVEIY